MKFIIWKNISTIILSFLGGILSVWILLPAISYGQGFSDAESNFPYDIQGQEYNPDDPNNIPTTDIASGLITQDTNEPTSLLRRLTDFFRLSGTSYTTATTSPATEYVKWILNIFLWLVSFLSLVMVIFAFYLIFFSKGEEAVGKAKKILIGVAIALAMMGLSRFIASFFFDIYTTVVV